MTKRQKEFVSNAVCSMLHYDCLIVDTYPNIFEIRFNFESTLIIVTRPQVSGNANVQGFPAERDSEFSLSRASRSNERDDSTCAVSGEKYNILYQYFYLPTTCINYANFS